jgi:translation initiation factor IF-3
MMRFADSLKEYAEIESNPKLEGRTMIMMLAPKKEN